MTNSNKVKFPDMGIKRGKCVPLNTVDNLEAMCNHFDIKPSFNQMTLEVDIEGFECPEGDSQDIVKSELWGYAEKTGIDKSVVDNHLFHLGYRNRYHPLVDLFENEQWDGINRVDKVIDAVNAKSSAVALIVLKKWMISAIAALYEPGFSTKLVPILHGKQSYLKTAFINRISSFTDLSAPTFLEGAEINPKDKDNLRIINSRWIVEIGEAKTTLGSNADRLKNFFSNSEDVMRLPYAKGPVTKPRKSVFIATVNDSDFLQDKTGNTRYAVIELNDRVDIEAVNSILGWTYQNGRLRQDDPQALKQFWLEVKNSFDNGASWFLDDEEQLMVEEVNSNFMQVDALEERFDSKIMFSEGSADHKYSASEVCNMIGLDAIRYAGRIGRIMTKRFGNSERSSVNGVQQRYYLTPKMQLRGQQEQIHSF